MRPQPVLLAVLVVVASFAAWYLQPWAETRRVLFADAVAAPAAGFSTLSEGYAVETVVQGLELPWDLVFLSKSEILVTEKAGRLTRIDTATGARTIITGMPPVSVHGQGGLHAVILHPRFAENRLLYFSHAGRGERGGYTTYFQRARLDGNALKDLSLLLRADAATGRGQHFGGAMAFDDAGYLFMSVGDRGERDRAQDLDTHIGKIMRLHDDGRVPADNPFVKTPGARPEIWSYGHRNPQGMAWDTPARRLYAVEHGPRGGDEINWIRPGLNYGWPVVTYGREYATNRQIGEGTSKPGMEQPLHWYAPSIATGGLATYAGEAFPAWRGDLFVAALGGHLNRVALRDGAFEKEERLLTEQNLRLRSVRVSPSGELWLTADSGVVLRVRPGV